MEDINELIYEEDHHENVNILSESDIKISEPFDMASVMEPSIETVPCDTVSVDSFTESSIETEANLVISYESETNVWNIHQENDTNLIVNESVEPNLDENKNEICEHGNSVGDEKQQQQQQHQDELPPSVFTGDIDTCEYTSEFFANDVDREINSNYSDSRNNNFEFSPENIDKTVFNDLADTSTAAQSSDLIFDNKVRD